MLSISGTTNSDLISAEFKVTATDDDSTGSGGTLSAFDTFMIEILETNLRAVCNDGNLIEGRTFTKTAVTDTADTIPSLDC